jgi:hypothetical protein
MKRYLHRKQLADRYGVVERTVDRMIEDGRLPPPDFVSKRSPLWSEETLERHERMLATSFGGAASAARARS